MHAWKRPDPQPLRQDFHQFHCVEVVGRKVAVATFRGEAAATHELVHVFSAMDQALEELLDSQQPEAIILDLRELKYSWGDEMACTLCVPSNHTDYDFPVVVVTSDLNREGLTSLMRDEMMSDPNDWLTDTEDDAFALLSAKLDH